MKEYFKKGQIVPKRLKMVFTHRKAHAHVTFGCDVVVEGKTVSAVSPCDSPIMVVHAYKGIKRKNGTFQRTSYAFKDFRIDATNARTPILICSFTERTLRYF